MATGDAATSDLAEFVTDFLDADPTRDPDAGEIALAYLRHLGKPITDASTTSLAQAVTYHLPG